MHDNPTDNEQPVDYTAILFKNHRNIDSTQKPSLYSTIEPANVQNPPINPYIGLKARLSRIYASYPLMLLLLILAHLYSSLTSLNTINIRTKHQITASCLHAESAANLLSLTPQTLLHTLKQTALATAQTTIHVTSTLISASVHILNLIVIWVIHRYTKLIVCVFDTVAGVLLDAVKAFAEVIRDAINKQLKVVEDVLDGTLHELNAFLRVVGVVGTDVEHVFSDFVGLGAHLFGKDNPLARIQDIKMPQVNEHLHFEIPESFVTDIKAFNPPTLEQIETKFDGFVSIPFDMLRKLITTSFDAMNATKDVGAGFMTSKYVPERFSFCKKDKLHLKWVDKFTDGIRRAILWVCLMIVSVAVGMVLVHALSIIYWSAWDSIEQAYLHKMLAPPSAINIAPALLSEYEKSVFLQDSVSFIKHPVRHRILVTLSHIFPSKRWQHRFRWFIDYTFYPPALLCLAIGLLGAASILVQVWIINRAEHHDLPSLVMKANLHLVHLSEDLTVHINALVLPYTTLILADITQVETTVNNDLSAWVDRIVQKVDEIITLVVKTYTNLIQSTFGFFPFLAETILKFVTCMLGIKIQDVDAVAAFIKEAFTVTIPRPDTSLFAITKEQIDKFVMPFFEKEMHGTAGQSGGMLGSLVQGVNEYKAELLKQLWMCLVIAGVGASVVLWGLLSVACWCVKDVGSYLVRKRL